MVARSSVPSLKQNRAISLFKPSGYPQQGDFGVRGRLIAKLATLPARYMHNQRIFSRFLHIQWMIQCSL